MIGGQDLLGVLYLVFALLCLGTWPAILRFCSITDTLTKRDYLPPYHAVCCGSCVAYYHLERPRNICHVYLDFSTAYFIMSTVPLLVSVAVTNDGYTVYKSDVPAKLVGCAMLGGVMLSIGNLALQWSTTVYEAPLTTVLAIQAAFTMLVSSMLNYFVIEPARQRGRDQHPLLVAAGVLFMIIAIVLAASAQVIYAIKMQNTKTSRSRINSNGYYRELDIEMNGGGGVGVGESRSRSWSPSKSRVSDSSEDDDISSLGRSQPIGGASSVSSSMSGNNSSHNHSSDQYKPLWGLIIAILGGFCFGVFSPAFNIAVNDPFHWTQESYPYAGGYEAAYTGLSVSEANLWFSLAFYVASVVGNTLLLQRQFEDTATSVLWTYLTRDNILDRQLAMSAGLVCVLGNVLQFRGGQMAGYMASNVVQAYPLVSTIWDFVLFGEFHTVSIRSVIAVLLIGMYVAYIFGIALFAGSTFD